MIKKHNVGILTEHFIKWGGGVDFIRLIIKGLASLNSNEATPKVSLFVLIPKCSRLKIKLKNFLKIVLNFCFNKKYVIQKEIDVKQIITAFKEVDSNIEICFYYNLDKDLSKQVLKNKIDFIIPAFVPLSVNFPIPWVGYLYDFQHKYYPQFFSVKELTSRDKDFATMLNTANTVIVNAKSVKTDIENFIGKTNAKVVSLPFCPVLNPKFFNLDVDISKYKLPEHYFMVANQFWRHKDHVTAIKAFKLFLDKQDNKNFGLVCTGQTHDSRVPHYFDEILALIEQLRLNNNVYILGYLPKNDQLQILKQSIAVIQPTLFEGGPGGFAVYESVAFGIPSIVSDIAVNQELDDETVSFFKTGDAEDLASKMIFLATTPPKIYTQDQLIAKNQIALQRLGKQILSTFDQI